MKTIKLQPREPYNISLSELGEQVLDIGGRDIVIGFNEPSPKAGKGGEKLYSTLNARLPVYFLPAIDIAIGQKRRPQFYIMSGINIAMKWNANSEEERVKMLAQNKIKFDFLKSFLDTFYPDTFSIVEYVVAQDPLRISEGKLAEIWVMIEKAYPTRSNELKKVFARFKKPNKFNSKDGEQTELQKFTTAQNKELMDAIKYSISHLFVFGDTNFQGNYYLNPNGFASIGGHQEKYFNEVRNLAFEVLKNDPSGFFEQPVILRDNVQITIEKADEIPTPYSGSTKGNSKRLVLDEATYENELDLVYYDDRPKLKPDMDYLYRHVPRDKYQKFWNDYKVRYLDLKSRYEEAYQTSL